jgi:peroxiredoxin Q/BCP
MLSVNDKAPAFTLKNNKGNDISLSQFMGKNVILYFYPKDNTPGCTREAKHFRDDFKKFSKKNTVILGVSPDSVDSHEKFRQKYDLPFELLSDPSRKVIESYGVWKQRFMYGKKSMGLERTTFIIGEDGKILKIFPKVQVDGHVEEVLEALT